MNGALDSEAMTHMWKWTLLVGLILLANDARAQTLDIQAGRLMGAFGVQVNGTFYDVAFVDGTCVSLFDGCDEPSDFVVNDLEDSIAFAQAIENIWNSNDSFDREPELTNGCGNPHICFIYTPIHFDADPNMVRVRRALNLKTIDSESVYAYKPVDKNTVFVNHEPEGPNDPLPNFDATYAVWSLSAAPEPVPSSGALAQVVIVLSLLLLGARSMRREKVG